MDVILLEKIAGLGDFGAQVAVKPGYARNYLLPQKKAQPATPENLRIFAEKRAEWLERIAGERAAAEARAERVGALTVRIAHRVGVEGRLFGSVTPAQIAEAVAAAGVELDKSEVRLPHGPLRTEGTHTVQLRLHPEVECALTLEVVGQ